MIDLSKPPEGATHYCDSGGCSPVYYKVGLGWAVFTDGFGWRDSNNEAAWFVKNCKPINSWTIYNNTKPLIELTDEQAGKMIKHGGEIEHMNPYNKEWGVVKIPSWAKSCVYRAKQKSERELFIEATLLATKPFSMDVAIVKAIADDMFNAGFKAPEDKQC